MDNVTRFYTTGPGVRTTLIWRGIVASMGGRESEQTKQFVNSELGLHRDNLRGTVHLWQYANGDVRYTFQPE